MVWAQIFNRLVSPTQARRTPAQYRTRARRRAWLGHSIRHISTSPQPFCFGATASHFEVHGSLADVYFECHYIDVATGVKMSDVSYGRLGQPSTGLVLAHRSLERGPPRVAYRRIELPTRLAIWAV